MIFSDDLNPAHAENQIFVHWLPRANEAPLSRFHFCAVALQIPA
jgi:hypothetical protein